MLQSIQMKNLLSYGVDSEPIPLRPLNLIIGPNGSGKSNLLEGIALLQSAPSQLVAPIREGGGIHDWLWKGTKPPVTASLEIVVKLPANQHAIPLRYRIDFTASGNRFEIIDERIENAEKLEGHSEPYFYYRYENNRPVLNIKATPNSKTAKKRYLQREDVDPEKSILAQRRDPDIYPEITNLADTLAKIRIYRDWSLGRYTPPRLPQPSDLPNQWLEENARNLGLVLNRLRRDHETKSRLLESFRVIYSEAEDFDVIIEAGTVQIFVQESRFNVPATRLSDGTLRYLCLLAILYDPAPPPLVCIDEPELGLHPDLIHSIAMALRFASSRTQVIVTTHSTALVDAFTDDPEVVLVCEKRDGCSIVHRLDAQRLQPWLEKYRLGSLWSSGEIGGNRW
ncbi:MAG: AAA family ATPase [Magnetococcales bacterium]|nr:AAA family ATPase [Magnetococcales bacterium]NGZ25420.1 AAA family ATPase [Magnetococcales bacterium]